MKKADGGDEKKFVEVYREEAYELITELETSLLELEESPGDMELVGEVFRALHTIKGSGAMFGFDEIASFTHEVETVFDQVRDGKVGITKELVNIALAARDHIRSMLDLIGTDGVADASLSAAIVAALREFQEFQPVAGEDAPSTGDADGHHKGSDGVGKVSLYRIVFRPFPDILKKGTNPVNLLNELRGFGECRIKAHTDEIKELEKHDPEECRTYWDILLTTDRGENAIRDVFIFIEDDCELTIEDLIEDSSLGDGEYKKVGEILVDRGIVTEKDLRKALKAKSKVGDLLVDAGLLTSDDLDSALVEQKEGREAVESRYRSEAAASIRVPSERLDKLVNLVGELVTVQASLSQTVTSKANGNTDLQIISEQVERLTDELRDITMGIRMVPIGTTFSKFKRLVRDLSDDLGRRVDLLTDGGETELDKTVIEKLDDPLVHLIRNSICHGIETPEEREAVGKPASGVVHLSASHSGPHVYITIKDDGKGFDCEAIRATAVDKGLISADEQLSEKETYALVFMPGFTTAKDVTSVSGRGVGLDVVNRSIDSLRGTVEIESVAGGGTTITLKLPLTLAIIDGLLVSISEEHFVIALSAIESCVELTDVEIKKSSGRHFVEVHGEIVPYIVLRDLFHVTGEVPEIQQIVIVNFDGERVGFVVDGVVGEQHTVIKTLGRFYKGIVGISGATILGDGSVALILDIENLVRMVKKEQAEGLEEEGVSEGGAGKGRDQAGEQHA